MEPIFKDIDSFTVVGLSARFIASGSRDANNLVVIPKLWHDYMQRSGEVKSRLSPIAYGLVIPIGDQDKKSHPDEMLYLAGASVASGAPVPAGMTSVTVPAGKYALFTHKGPLDNLARTTKAIYTEWMPQSGCKMRSAPHLEIYDSRFKLGQPDSEFDICVPIE